MPFCYAPTTMRRRRRQPPRATFQVAAFRAEGGTHRLPKVYHFRAEAQLEATRLNTVDWTTSPNHRTFYRAVNAWPWWMRALAAWRAKRNEWREARYERARENPNYDETVW